MCAMQRRRLTVRGRVQGVGFRPFVYRVATGLGLTGHVGNDPTGVFIEVQGEPDDLESFERRLKSDAPAIARVSSIESVAGRTREESAFAIVASSGAGPQSTQVSPDIATCAECAAELRDASDRRHGYPFVNCTNCGPRYSIVRGVPYDRPKTTMASFLMCPQCRREYDDPLDRRFHAQPNACPVCGPRAVYADAHGRPQEGEAVALAASRLAAGDLIAVKGLGGFHLACRADLDRSVGILRERKRREAKPLALMAASLEEAMRLVTLDEVSTVELCSWRRPIVLAPRRVDAPVSGLVAPDVTMLGVMLPYTPLHLLLFDRLCPAGVRVLVMTSANPTDEPLCADNDEAVRRLQGIADGYLLHDRDIDRRVDDSVVVAITEPEDGIVPLRRARGYVPEPIDVPVRSSEPVLAVGAEMKSTVCVLDGSTAVLSEHLGELSNPAAFRGFVSAVERVQELLAVRPTVVACDLHPGYQSTVYARNLGWRSTAVQHHHAHAVSCMAENGLTGRVVAVIADGTGYGTDGAVWGCEVLVTDEKSFRRESHLSYFALPGGDRAAIDTWRPAAGLVHAAFGDAVPAAFEQAFARIETDALGATRALLASNAAVASSSLGRTFDALAFLLGVCDRNRYEAEAAMRLEAMATLEGCRTVDPLPFALSGDAVIDVRPALSALAERLVAGESARDLSCSIHEGLARALADAAARAAEAHGLERLVLSGGCFANRILLARVFSHAHNLGLKPFWHRIVPTGDGGISLGQAVCAAARLISGDF
jgi:hydrogenase maturation protein HypF